MKVKFLKFVQELNQELVSFRISEIERDNQLINQLLASHNLTARDFTAGDGGEMPPLLAILQTPWVVTTGVFKRLFNYLSSVLDAKELNVKYGDTSLLWSLAYLNQKELYGQLFASIKDEPGPLNVVAGNESVLFNLAYHRHWAHCAQLLERVKDEKETLNVKNSWGLTVLWLFTRFEQWDLFERLLGILNSHGIKNLNAAHKEGVSILWCLASKNRKELFENFLALIKDEPGSLNTVFAGQSVLFHLARHGQWAYCEQLLEKAKNEKETLNVQNDLGITVLWLFARFEQWDLFERLLAILKAHGIRDLNAVHKVTQTSILWLLAKHDKEELYGQLFTLSTDEPGQLNVVAGSESVLFNLAFHEQWTHCQQLLDRVKEGRERLNVKNDFEIATLGLFASYGQWALFQQFFNSSKGHILEGLNTLPMDTKASILWFLALHNKEELYGQFFVLVKDQPGPLNGVYEGENLIFQLARHQHWTHCEQLLERVKGEKVTLNIKNESGITLLWLFASYGQWNLFNRLLEILNSHGIQDLNTVHTDGRSILWLLANSNHSALFGNFLELTKDESGPLNAIYEGQSVLSLLRKHQQWGLFVKFFLLVKDEERGLQASYEGETVMDMLSQAIAGLQSVSPTSNLPADYPSVLKFLASKGAWEKFLEAHSLLVDQGAQINLVEVLQPYRNKDIIFELAQVPYALAKQIIEMSSDFLCPLTQRLMFYPISMDDGHTYEKEALERYIQLSRRARYDQDEEENADEDNNEDDVEVLSPMSREILTIPLRFNINVIIAKHICKFIKEQKARLHINAEAKEPANALTEGGHTKCSFLHPKLG